MVGSGVESAQVVVQNFLNDLHLSPTLQTVVEQMDAASCTQSFREYWREKREVFVKINVIISVIISLI